MRSYCEIMVKDILPALRSFIARELMAEYKLNQSEVAKLLGVSQPAVSQYLRELRGREKKILRNEAVSLEIKRLCQKIYERRIDSLQLVREFHVICKTIKDTGLIEGYLDTACIIE